MGVSSVKRSQSLKQFAQSDFKCLRQGLHRIDAGGDRAVFYLRQVRPSNARKFSQIRLTPAVLFAEYMKSSA